MRAFLGEKAPTRADGELRRWSPERRLIPPRYLGGLSAVTTSAGCRVTWRTSAGCRAPSQVFGGCRAAKNLCGEGTRELAHFCTQKASGDKAVTSGDELSGLEFAGFSGQKTDFGARRTHGTGFRRKTSEFGGPGTTFNAGHEKTHFSEFAVFSAFCTKNGVVTKRPVTSEKRSAG